MIQNKSFLVLFIYLCCQLQAYAQSKYVIKDNEGFDFVLNITVDGNMINGYTREKALLDYASKFNYHVVKLLSPLKHSEIIRFRAILANGNFEGTYDYLFSSYKIVGKISTDSISYSLFKVKENELVGSFKGNKVAEYARKDYKRLAEDIIRTTEEHIFDPRILNTSKWINYKKKFLSASSKTIDDLEFQIGFFALTRKIGFSHYYLFSNQTATIGEREKPSLKEIDGHTVLLKLPSFAEKKESIKPLLDSILQMQYTTLIIDLRNNTGGNFESTFLVANFLTNKEFISGFFPNRNWYNTYNRLPGKSDIDMFSLMDSDTTQIHSKYGFYIKTKGAKDRFKGRAYLLVNHNTGSAAEVLAIGAKEYKLAEIVGENTAGGLLKVKHFMIDQDVVLVVPVNDFISYNGYRVDQKGVKPDIKTRKGKELEEVEKWLKKKGSW